MGNGLFLSLCKSIGKSGDYIDGYADGYEEGYARAFERAEENYYANCEPNVKLCEICKKYDGCMLWCMGRGFVANDVVQSSDELSEVCIKALESAERYKWHDLRKDPEDLPKEEGRKYIITQCGTDKYHIASWFSGSFGEWGLSPVEDDTCVFNEFARVDRWREIEPFTDDYIMPENSDHRKQRGRTAPNEEEK